MNGQRTARLGLTLMMLATMMGAANAQRLVGALSNRQISITSTFAGETLTLFGNIEPELDATTPYVEGKFDIVVVISGPVQDRVVRKKTNAFGIWLNTEQTVFRNFPSFKWVLSSGPLEDVADVEQLTELGITPGSNLIADSNGKLTDVEARDELLRLMQERAFFGVDEHGVRFESRTLYSTRIVLPSGVQNGSFLAKTFLFKDGNLVTHKAEGFVVRKEGFERFLGETAHDMPLIYGLFCVILAVFTGWLGGIVFKR